MTIQIHGGLEYGPSWEALERLIDSMIGRRRARPDHADFTARWQCELSRFAWHVRRDVPARRWR